MSLSAKVVESPPLQIVQRHDQWRRILGRVIDLGIIPLLFFLVLHYPDYRHGFVFYWDEGQHLACIQRLFHGQVLFRDIYDITAPLPELIPYLMMKFSTIDVSVLRTFYYYGTLLSLFTIYLTGLSLTKNRLAAVLLMLLSVKYFIYNVWASRWGGFRIGTAFVAILLLWVFLDSGKRKWLAACGVAAAVSLLFSPEMGIFCLFLGGLAIVSDGVLFERQQPLKTPVRKSLMIFLLSFAAGLLPWVLYALATGSLRDYVVINFYDIPFRLTKALPYQHELRPFPDLWWRPDRWKPVWRFFQSSTGLYRLAWLVLIAEMIYLIHARFKSNWNKKDLIKLGIALFLIYLVALAGFGGMAWALLDIVIACLILIPFRNKWNRTHMKRFMILLFGVYLLVLAKRNVHETAPQLNYALAPALILFAMQFSDASTLLAKRLWNRIGKRREKHLPAQVLASLPVVLLSAALFAYMAYDNHGRPYQLLEPYHILPDKLLEMFPPDAGLLDLPRCRNVRMREEDAVAIMEISNFIMENTSPSEGIFAFPMDGRYYFLTDRHNPTRFDIAINVAIDKAYEQECVGDLERSPAAYVIYDKKAPRLGSLPNKERAPLLYDYLMTHYQPIFEAEGAVVMERIKPDAT